MAEDIPIVILSAKAVIKVSMKKRARSLKYKINNMGPSVVSWCTPIDSK